MSRRFCWLWLFALAVFAPRYATGASGMQPTSLPLGTVATGSTIEVSFLLFGNSATTAGLKVDVQPPDFIRVERIKLITRGEPKLACCEVVCSVDTARVGKFAGGIRVGLGDVEGEIPITVTVCERHQEYPEVLIVSTPFDRYSTSSGADFSQVTDLVRELKATVHYCCELPRQLNGYDTVLFSCDALALSDDKTLLKLMEFVEAGGHVVVTANAFYMSTVPQANRLLEGFGLEIEDRDWTRDCIVDRIAESPYTTGVSKLKFFRPSLIKLTEAGKGRILVPAPPTEGINPEEAGFIATARGSKRGEIIVIGQSLWWHWLGQNAERGDARRLLLNLLQASEHPVAQ